MQVKPEAVCIICVAHRVWHWNIKIPTNVSKKKVLQRKGEIGQLAFVGEEAAVPGRKGQLKVEEGEWKNTKPACKGPNTSDKATKSEALNKRPVDGPKLLLS